MVNFFRGGPGLFHVWYHVVKGELVYPVLKVMQANEATTAVVATTRTVVLDDSTLQVSTVGVGVVFDLAPLVRTREFVSATGLSLDAVTIVPRSKRDSTVFEETVYLLLPPVATRVVVFVPGQQVSLFATTFVTPLDLSTFRVLVLALVVSTHPRFPLHREWQTRTQVLAQLLVLPPVGVRQYILGSLVGVG